MKLTKEEKEKLAKEAFSKIRRSPSIKAAVECYENYQRRVTATGEVMHGIGRKKCASCLDEYFGMHDLCKICSTVYEREYRN